MAKLFWSLLVSIVVLYIAKSIGWIGMENLPILVTNVIWNQLIWLGIIALAFTAVSYVCGQIFILLVALTCGVGCVFLPVYMLGIGYLKLLAVTYILPGFTYTHAIIPVLILSLFVGAYIPSSTTTTSSSAISSSDNQ